MDKSNGGEDTSENDPGGSMASVLSFDFDKFAWKTKTKCKRSKEPGLILEREHKRD